MYFVRCYPRCSIFPLPTVSSRNPWCPGFKTDILQEDGSERKFCENKIQEEKCDKNTKKSCNHYKFCRLHIKVRTKNVVLLYFRQASPQVASKIYHSFRENLIISRFLFVSTHFLHEQALGMRGIVLKEMTVVEVRYL
jgi:hypothetical protein